MGRKRGKRRQRPDADRSEAQTSPGRGRSPGRLNSGGTGGKRQRRPHAEARSRGGGENNKTAQPYEALNGRKVIAQWRKPWECDAPALLPLSSFLFLAAPSGRLRPVVPPVEAKRRSAVADLQSQASSPKPPASSLQPQAAGKGFCLSPDLGVYFPLLSESLVAAISGRVRCMPCGRGEAMSFPNVPAIKGFRADRPPARCLACLIAVMAALVIPAPAAPRQEDPDA